MFAPMHSFRFSAVQASKFSTRSFPGSVVASASQTTTFQYRRPYYFNANTQKTPRNVRYFSRSVRYFERQPILVENGHKHALQTTRAFIGLGSNVGDRLDNIDRACRMIDDEGEMLITQTSSLYNTQPMYVKSQEFFLNAVCEIATALKPLELLDRLQSIEKQLGRVKTINKGPRPVDLDIILYGDHVVASDRLTVPHSHASEREFVLRPLCDISTSRHRALDTKSGMRVEDFLKEVPRSEPAMLAHTPLNEGDDLIIRPNDAQRRTHVMSIINMTPDSFSDGGKYRKEDLEYLTSTVRSQIAAGVTLIDIGGQSSRPNAPDVTADEELARVLPAIDAIKNMPEAANIAISIDTYRAAVAEGAVKAGAHIVNDISAGLLDPEMLPTISRLGCTYVMTHMRGTPSTMMSPENLSYPKGLLSTVAAELGERVDAAQAVGIRRWRIILDPGIGFAKTVDHNLEVLRRFADLKADPRLRNLPWLVGASRKSFIGKITGEQDPTRRDWATAATMTAAVHGGADIVRVHAAEPMCQVVKMADAMYRSQ